ncbi:hypothetical protein [Natronosalvus rutilus]|uniref:Uncharacterized protein n=1 Tax=Natronosalvus rutilus TaxID=2953753 RepID=A0A9E7SVM1_9EURY|nr:hypothetical protein [Natronosalvus rutilus]UTF56004.1 hypothetical protein NGM29_20670 [Natronosalvus rutilus]
MTFEEITDLMVEPQDEDDVEAFAEYLHEQYEEAAADAGWQTQDGTSVPFDELPEENRETMLGLARRVSRRFLVVDLDDGAVGLKEDEDLEPDFDYEAGDGGDDEEGADG